MNDISVGLGKNARACSELGTLQTLERSEIKMLGWHFFARALLDPPSLY